MLTSGLHILIHILIHILTHTYTHSCMHARMRTHVAERCYFYLSNTHLGSFKLYNPRWLLLGKANFAKRATQGGPKGGGDTPQHSVPGEKQPDLSGLGG